MMANYHHKTVIGFGEEWNYYDQSSLSNMELGQVFTTYFGIFPWQCITANSVGFDLGCGSGRWAKLIAPKVGKLYCVDASQKALDVARGNLKEFGNCNFVEASVNELPFPNNSMDFGYSLGVLHHLPDTQAGIKACVDKLKEGAPLLLYIYYAFDNRPWWFRSIWRLTDVLRRGIARLPFKLRLLVTQVIAIVVYYPLARLARLLELAGCDVDGLPLSAYRSRSLYTMRTDALDRFGTQLEKRYTADQIRQMMTAAGLERVRFNDSYPYWCAVGYKKGTT
jgi:SAM-dependent methyltransferase